MAEALHQVRCQLVRSLPAADHVLDLGGAAPASIQGALLVMGYPHRVRSLTIVDLPPAERLNKYEYGQSERATKWTDTEMGPVRYLHTSMTDLSMIESNSLDLVFAGQSIEHVSEAGGLQVMHEAFRVLRPGGSFCLDTPNRTVTSIQSPYEYLHPEHQIEYCVADLTNALQGVGFQIKAIKGIGPIPQTVQSGVFSELELLDNAHLSEQAEICYLFYVHCIKPD
jgi:SAM-dependent methyltransferase